MKLKFKHDFGYFCDDLSGFYDVKETETVVKMDDETLADDNDEDDDDDPVEKEIDVYISKSLANNIYVLQVCLF